MPNLPPLMAELRVQASDVHQKFGEAMKASDELAKKTAGDSAATGGAFDKLSRTGQIAFGGIVGGIGTVTGESAHMAADFQEKMTLLVTGAGESKDKVDEVANGILNMAPKVQTSTGQLADGMYMIESAGFHGAQGLSVLQSAAEGAKVGNADLGTTADALTTVMKDYHLPASQAANVTSQLVTTVASGKTHMQDLATSMASILPFSSGLGVSLKDTLGAMATMTGNGIQADQAATYLKFSMMALANETPKGSKALKDVGLSSIKVATDLKNKGLSGTLAEITDAIGKKFPKGSAQYNAALSDIVGGTRGMAAALALTGKNAGTYTQNIKNIGASTAEAGGHVKGFGDASQDMNSKMAGIGASFEAVGIKLGTQLIPWLSKAADNFLTLFNYLESHQGVVITLATIIGSVLVPVMAAFAIKATGDAVKGALEYGSMAKSMITSTASVVRDLPMLSKGFKDVLGGLDGSYGKVGAFGAQVGGLVSKFGSAASAAGSWSKGTATALASNTKELVLNGAAWVKNAAATVAATTAKLAGAAATKLMAAAEVILNAVLAIDPITLIVIALVALVAGIIWAYNSLGWFKDGVNAVLGFIGQAFQNVVSFITTVLGVLGNLWMGFWNGPFGKLVQAVWKLIITIVQFAVAWIVTTLRSNISIITSMWTTGWNAVVNFLKAAWNVIVTAVRTAVGFVHSVIVSYLTMVQTIWSAIWNGISSFFTGIWNGIVSFITGVMNTIFGAITGPINDTKANVSSTLGDIWNSWQTIWNNIESFIGTIWDKIVSGVSGAIGKVVSVISGLGGQILAELGKIVGDVFNAGANIVNSIAKGITSAIGAVTGAIGNIVQTITDHMPHSPAKRGPLSGRGYTLYSGQKLVSDLALGMTSNIGDVALAASMVAGAAAGPDSLAYGSGPRTSSGGTAPTGASSAQASGNYETGGHTVNNYITVNAQTNATPEQIAHAVGYQLMLQG